MEKENKFLVGAIFVLIVLFLVGSNFSGVTGNVTKESPKTTIIISPEAVTTGELIHITVTPGPDGVNQKTSFYKGEDNLRKYSVDALCNNYRCSQEGSFGFVIPSSWENGIYYVKIYDYETKTFVEEDFTVIS